MLWWYPNSSPDRSDSSLCSSHSGGRHSKPEGAPHPLSELSQAWSPLTSHRSSTKLSKVKDDMLLDDPVLLVEFLPSRTIPFPSKLSQVKDDLLLDDPVCSPSSCRFFWTTSARWRMICSWTISFCSPSSCPIGRSHSRWSSTRWRTICFRTIPFCLPSSCRLFFFDLEELLQQLTTIYE